MVLQPRQEAGRVWLETGAVPAVGCGWDRYVHAVASGLRMMGEEVDDAWAMGVSGEAFGLCFASSWQENLCACVPFDGAVNVAAAYGYAGRWEHNRSGAELMLGLSVTERRCVTEAVLEDLYAEIDHGRPVPAQGVTAAGGDETVLVTGYDRERLQLCCAGLPQGACEWRPIRGLAPSAEHKVRGFWDGRVRGDRKSTRLNSSHYS